jgi:hypothetical protein
MRVRDDLASRSTGGGKKVWRMPAMQTVSVKDVTRNGKGPGKTGTPTDSGGHSS